MQDDILSDIFYKAFEKVIKINLKEGTFEEIEKIIGDKIAVIKSKKEASIAEVSNKLNSKMQSLISKIITFDFR